MEQIIQRIKNIFADADYQNFKYVSDTFEYCWKSKDERVSKTHLSALIKIRIDIEPEINLWYFEDTDKYFFIARTKEGWIFKLPIVQNAQTNDLTNPPLSSNFGDKDLENSNY